MHGFGTPVKRPPDSITPRFRRPIRNNIHPSKNTSLINKKKPAETMLSNIAGRPSMRFSARHEHSPFPAFL